jgi:hypothetical protein
MDKYLKCAEMPVAVEGEMLLHPFLRALVLGVETHEKHGVNGVDDGIADASAAAEVRTAVTDRMIFVVSECISFCGRQ